MITVTVLLWTTLLIGPLITGSVWVWVELSDVPMGGLAVLVYGIISFTAAYWSATLALLIQIWRDQWRAKLTGVSVAFLFLLFLPYVWVHTLNPANQVQNKPLHQIPDPPRVESLMANPRSTSKPALALGQGCGEL